MEELMKDYIVQPERRIEVCEDVDVLIVGGGPGGFPAAIAAAVCAGVGSRHTARQDISSRGDATCTPE